MLKRDNKVPQKNKAQLKICLVSATPLSLLVFMMPHIKVLNSYYNITLVANGRLGDVASLTRTGVSYKNINIIREVSLLPDLLALISLLSFLLGGRFQIVQSITPKAGLLTMVAALFARVPVRVHWFTGQVWATKSGSQRWFLKLLDRLLAACATHLLADSPSQRDFLIAERIATADKITVLGSGSVSGVDTSRFKPSLVDRARLRTDLYIPENAMVALYLGRFNRDKGLHELTDAFLFAAQKCSDLHLLLVGPDEDKMRSMLSKALDSIADRVHFVEYTAEPEAFMAAADFFVLPSHREGFGTSVIEASACGIPAIGSKIYGLTDAIEDGESGLLVPVGDISRLADAISKLATDSGLRLSMGRRARERAIQKFGQDKLTEALLNYYCNLISTKAVDS